MQQRLKFRPASSSASSSSSGAAAASSSSSSSGGRRGNQQKTRLPSRGAAAKGKGRDPNVYLKNVMRNTPLPADDGVHFKTFNASSVNANSRRSSLCTHDASSVLKQARKPVKRTFDAAGAARKVLDRGVDLTTALTSSSR